MVEKPEKPRITAAELTVQFRPLTPLEREAGALGLTAAQLSSTSAVLAELFEMKHYATLLGVADEVEAIAQHTALDYRHAFRAHGLGYRWADGRMTYKGHHPPRLIHERKEIPYEKPR